MAKYLDYDGLSHLWSNLKNKFQAKEAGKGLSTNDFTDALKTKLDGIATGATKVTVDSALSSSSTNPVQNKVIVTALNGKASTDTATTTAKGLMSSEDKVKLDGVAEGANKTIVDTSITSGGTNPVTGGAIYTALAGKASTAVASSTANGLMSKDDYKKLSALPSNTTLESTYAKKSDVTGVYIPKGSVASLDNLAPLTQQTLGSVYDISAEFTTTAEFIEGEGHKYSAGTNIVVVLTDDGTKMWDVFGGRIDVSAITNSEIDTIMAS